MAAKYFCDLCDKEVENINYLKAQIYNTTTERPLCKATLSFKINPVWYEWDDIYKSEPSNAEICEDCLKKEVKKALFDE